MKIKINGKTNWAKGSYVKLDCSQDTLSCDGFSVQLAAPLPRSSYWGKVLSATDTETEVSVELYAHLHGHSDNSLLDGLTKVKDYVKYGTHDMALTDHGVLYGMVDFYKQMKKAGKKAIIAFEAYVEDPLTKKLDMMHLCLFAKDLTGYHNLLKLCSLASDTSYRGKPHVTDALLRQYHEGVVASAACLGGPIQQYLLKDDVDSARKIVEYYCSIFGKENFFLEVQRHHIPEEPKVERYILLLSEEYGLPIIATTDSHYTHKDEAAAHEVLLCLQTGKTMAEKHMQFEGDGYWIHTSEEVEELFSDHPEWLDNTLTLAAMCDVQVPLGGVNLPHFDIPAPFATPEAFFDHLCREGYKEKFGHYPEDETDTVYRERYDYELAMIKQMGFVSYFLVVQDYIDWARKHDIYVGPGRGSAAGSLIAYCIGITDLDPIKLNLLFERFLNPERVSWPDVDTDFEHSRREEVINYVKEKYGHNNVCRIVTFGTMAARMAIRDVARVLGYPNYMGTSISKLIPEEPHMTIDLAMKKNPELKNRYESEPDVKKIIDVAKAVEGSKRHASQHACGVVLAPSPVDDFLPTSMLKNDETGEKDVTSQVVMSEVEELSLLKMDFLGLKNMGVIHFVMDTIRRTRPEFVKAMEQKLGRTFRYQDIPLTDRETYKMLSKGMTAGVFQLESPGMTDVVVRTITDVDNMPDSDIMQCFENLIAAVALYRPGPMDYIDDYVEGSHSKNIQYDLPEEEDILKSTYGVIVYQEQVMQLVQKLAGFSMGRADVVRKAMGKKKQDVMDAEREVFLYGNKAAFDSGKDEKYAPGCVANGIDENVAKHIWEKMENFAKYAFNRSHAACYAYIAYLTAYMSCHWKEEFYCGMLNAFIEISDKLRAYLTQAYRRGIEILPPDINKSDKWFSVEELLDENGNPRRNPDGSPALAIRCGLKGLKSVGKMADEIIRCRGDQPFESYYEFYSRCDKMGAKINRGALESLIYSGALNCFGMKKAILLAGISILDANSKQEAKVLDGQCNLFDEPGNEKYRGVDFDSMDSLKNLKGPDKRTLMEREKDSIGFYLTAHPMDDIYPLVQNDKLFKVVADLESSTEDIKPVKTAGIVKNIRQRFTKNNEEMCSFTLEDKFGSINCVIFPRYLPPVKDKLQEGAIVQVTGEMRIDDNFGNQIIVDGVLSEESIGIGVLRDPITIEIGSKNEQMELLDYIHSHPGHTPVILRAKGKDYPIKPKLSVTPETLNYLMSLFKVSCAKV